MDMQDHIWVVDILVNGKWKHSRFADRRSDAREIERHKKYFYKTRVVKYFEGEVSR